MHYLLFYEKAADYKERQGPFTTAHREHVFAAARGGELVLAGSLLDPDDGAALLVFQSDSPAPAEAFAKGDPYVVHGIVCHWRVRAWQTLSLPHVTPL